VSSKPKDPRGLTRTRKPKEPDKIRQYIASVEAKLEKATGKKMSHWVRVARKCPHGRPADRLRWLKAEHGLGLAHAAVVLGRAFGLAALEAEAPGDPLDRVFSKGFASQRPIFDAVVAFAGRLGGTSIRPRRNQVVLYRLKQYGVLKPSRKGLVLAFALKKYPKKAGLIVVPNPGASDRCKMALVLESRKDFGATAKSLLRQAHAEA
jgi:hypothetical protein